MSDETIEALLGNVARWCQNMLAELQRNYAARLTEEAQRYLKEAIVALDHLDNRKIMRGSAPSARTTTPRSPPGQEPLVVGRVRISLAGHDDDGEPRQPLATPQGPRVASQGRPLPRRRPSRR